MDSEKGFGHAGSKGGRVAFKEVANPQLYPYFLCMFVGANLLAFMLTILPSLSHNNETPSKAYGWIFMIMVVSFFLVLIASVVMVFASCYFNSWMRDIYYTILKTIGCFSGINGLVSLGAFFLVPKNLNWAVYLVISLICVCILATYYLLWKYVCTYQQNKLCNTFSIHWTVLVASLFPLMIASWPFIPPNFHPIWYVFTWGSFFMVVAAGYFSIKFVYPEIEASNLEPLMK